VQYSNCNFNNNNNKINNNQYNNKYTKIPSGQIHGGDGSYTVQYETLQHTHTQRSK